EVPPIVHEVLRAPGQPLNVSTRAFMQPRFGHDFSHVRIHDDALAASSARAVNALAYTAGREIVFDSGQYSPGTPEGRKLISHELAHVLQNGGSTPSAGMNSLARSAPASIGSVNDPSEAQADKAAEAVVSERTPSEIRASVNLGVHTGAQQPLRRKEIGKKTFAVGKIIEAEN